MISTSKAEASQESEVLKLCPKPYCTIPIRKKATPFNLIISNLHALQFVPYCLGMTKTNQIEEGLMHVNLPVISPDIFAGNWVKKIIWQRECHC
jgi:hypothetical protein